MEISAASFVATKQGVFDFGVVAYPPRFCGDTPRCFGHRSHSISSWVLWQQGTILANNMMVSMCVWWYREAGGDKWRQHERVDERVLLAPAIPADVWAFFLITRVEAH